MSTTATTATSPSVKLRIARVDVRTRYAAAVTLLVLVAFFLRLSQIHQSLLGDEYFTYQDIAGRSFASVLTTVHQGGENSPPLFFMLAWLTAHLGDATVWLRLPSIVLGSATVLIVYLLGRETVGRLAGLVAAGVLAITPFAVFYGIEARPYATMVFFVALSTYALLRALRTDARGWWAVYVLAAAAAAYSHYTSVFVLGVQALWSLWVRRQRIGTALTANVLIGIIYLPWLPQLRGKALAVIGALYPLTVGRVVRDVLRPIPGHPAAPLRAIPTLAGLAVFALIVITGLAILGRRWLTTPHRRTWPNPASNKTLIVVLMLATPVGLLLYSLLVTDLWLPRGLSASMPATALVLGALVAALPRPAVLVAVLAIAITLVAGTARSLNALYDRGPFRTIDQYLDRVAGPHDPVVIIAYAGAGPLTVEFRHHHDLVTEPVMWRSLRPGATGYIVFDEMLGRVLHAKPTAPPGFVQVRRIHYPSSLPMDVLAYRRVSSGA